MHLAVETNKKETVLPRIYRAALRLFVRKGIDATTTKDIARAARVSEGALYRHFKSKDALAYGLFSTHLQQFTGELAARVAAARGAKARAAAFVRECFEAFETERELFTFLILSEHRELARFPAGARHPGHVALEIVKEAQAEGHAPKEDPYIAASLFLGGVIRLCVVRMHGNLKDLRPSADAVAERLWRGMKA